MPCGAMLLYRYTAVQALSLYFMRHGHRRATFAGLPRLPRTISPSCSREAARMLQASRGGALCCGLIVISGRASMPPFSIPDALPRH